MPYDSKDTPLPGSSVIGMDGMSPQPSLALVEAVETHKAWLKIQYNRRAAERRMVDVTGRSWSRS